MIRKERMATVIANDIMWDFFEEVNRLEPKAKVPVAIDGIIEGKLLHIILQTSVSTHGYQPRDVLLGTIESIPKDNKKYIWYSSNYRGITLPSRKL